MTIESILPFLNSARKGQIVTLLTNRPAKTRKGAPAITKVSSYQVRIGHDYEAQASTIAARAEGMEHRDAEDDYAARLNEHLSYKKDTGRVYLSCQPFGTNAKATYFIGDDLTPKTKEDVLPALLSSETRDHSNTLHLRVPLDTIVTIK